MRNNLDFLETMFSTKDNKYKNQKYLKSNFDYNLWQIELEQGKFQINFDIELTDGGKLLSNLNLLNTVKYWILSNTLPDNGVAYSDSAIGYRIKYVISKYTIFHMWRRVYFLVYKYHIKQYSCKQVCKS